jgi:rhamnose utilization protein RhaD (predicted bifunctional aldolase and dehydrogenase)
MPGNSETILTDLIQLSRELGREDRQLAILGEGNTSADCGDGTFYVKASGSQLNNIEASGFSLVNLKAAMDVVANTDMNDEQVQAALQEVLVDKTHRKPSVETFLHAICIADAGAKFVGHTHAISVNSILCSEMGAKPFLGHLFPDGIVVCGVAPAVVPYTDPGFELAIAFRAELCRYQGVYGMPPRVVLMENHGIVSLGRSAREVLNIQLMADKWARVILGTAQFGGPHFLSGENVNRINSRLDEVFRRAKMV